MQPTAFVCPRLSQACAASAAVSYSHVELSHACHALMGSGLLLLCGIHFGPWNSNPLITRFFSAVTFPLQVLLTRPFPAHRRGLVASAVAACVQHEAAVAAAARESKRGNGATRLPKKEEVRFPGGMFIFDGDTVGREPRPTAGQCAPD